MNTREQKALQKLSEAQISLGELGILDIADKHKGGYDYFKSVIDSTYAYGDKQNFKFPAGKTVKIITTAGEYYWSNLKGESFGEFAAGLAGDIVQGGIATFFFGPAGLILNEFVPIDFGDDFKNIYRKITGDDSTDIAKKIGVKEVSVVNGILKVTMPDGTVYSRPLMPNISGLITGGEKDDVLFGGNGNDMLTGAAGDSDILIGGNGFDTYNANDKNIIRDIDHKGSVYFYGELTGR